MDEERKGMRVTDGGKESHRGLGGWMDGGRVGDMGREEKEGVWEDRGGVGNEITNVKVDKYEVFGFCVIVCIL